MDQQPPRLIQIGVKYLAPTTFDDRVVVTVSVKAFDGVRLTIGYTMEKEGEAPQTVLTGESEHVFLNAQGRFVRLKRELPEFYQLLTEMAGEAQEEN